MAHDVEVGGALLVIGAVIVIGEGEVVPAHALGPTSGVWVEGRCIGGQGLTRLIGVVVGGG